MLLYAIHTVSCYLGVGIYSHAAVICACVAAGARVSFASASLFSSLFFFSFFFRFLYIQDALDREYSPSQCSHRISLGLSAGDVIDDYVKTLTERKL